MCGQERQARATSKPRLQREGQATKQRQMLTQRRSLGGVRVGGWASFNGPSAKPQKPQAWTVGLSGKRGRHGQGCDAQAWVEGMGPGGWGILRDHGERGTRLSRERDRESEMERVCASLSLVGAHMSHSVKCLLFILRVLHQRFTHSCSYPSQLCVLTVCHSRAYRARRARKKKTSEYN